MANLALQITHWKEIGINNLGELLNSKEQQKNDDEVF